VIAVEKPEPKPRGRRIAVSRGASSAKSPFWQGASHPDNDRAGELLLKSLEAIREDAFSRGDQGFGMFEGFEALGAGSFSRAFPYVAIRRRPSS